MMAVFSASFFGATHATFHYFLLAASETWHLVSQGGGAEGGPSPRHRHSAVLHENAMWIFGGMTDLQERSDFWRFDFGKI